MQISRFLSSSAEEHEVTIYAMYIDTLFHELFFFCKKTKSFDVGVTRKAQSIDRC